MHFILRKDNREVDGTLGANRVELPSAFLMTSRNGKTSVLRARFCVDAETCRWASKWLRNASIRSGDAPAGRVALEAREAQDPAGIGCLGKWRVVRHAARLVKLLQQLHGYSMTCEDRAISM